MIEKILGILIIIFVVLLLVSCKATSNSDSFCLWADSGLVKPKEFKRLSKESKNKIIFYQKSYNKYCVDGI